MESYSDTNPFQANEGNSSNPNNNADERDYSVPTIENVPRVRINPNDLYYDMSGKKLLVILNHENYDTYSRYYGGKGPKKRIGTEEDVGRLDETFSKLGFTIELHNNKTFEDLWDILLELKSRDMAAFSCLCIAILTHGNKKGQLSAYDRNYELDDVLKLFENHSTLAGKPKLFFIQACRGGETDSGNTIATDGVAKGNIFAMPSHADFLVMRSSIEDYSSFRDCNGSWLIQEFCKAVLEYHQDLDILQIITLVHKAVAQGYTTYTPTKKSTHEKKQMPETTFTLTKFLKF